MEEHVSLTTFQGTGLWAAFEETSTSTFNQKKENNNISLITETFHAHKAAERKYATKSVTHNKWIDYL
jgi:hypothetical protein